MLLQILWGLEYFQIFDPFSKGLFASFYLFLLVFLFSYLGARGNSPKPLETGFEIATFTYFAAFFLSYLSPHPFIAGILVIVSFLTITRIVTKLRPVPLALLAIYFAFLFSVLSILEPWMRNILLLFSLSVAYLRGNLRLWDKKDFEKEKKEK